MLKGGENKILTIKGNCVRFIYWGSWKMCRWRYNVIATLQSTLPPCNIHANNPGTLLAIARPIPHTTLCNSISPLYWIRSLARYLQESAKYVFWIMVVERVWMWYISQLHHNHYSKLLYSRLWLLYHVDIICFFVFYFVCSARLFAPHLNVQDKAIPLVIVSGD